MAQQNNARFRNQGHAVTPDMSTGEMLNVAGMDWKTIPMPMLIQGKTQNRPSAFKSLVRSNDGYELGVATEDYNPIHNAQIVDSMKRIADAGEMTITSLGALDHGRRIFAACQMGESFNVTDPNLTDEARHAFGGSRANGLDTVELNGLMGSGHVPGISFTFEGWGERLTCLNGAKISKSARARFSMRHVTDFNHVQEAKLRASIRAIKAEFLEYRDQAQSLRNAKWDAETTRAFCCELLAPEMFKAALERTEIKLETPSLLSAPKSGYSLDYVLNRTAAYFRPSDQPTKRGEIGISRPAARVMELVSAQPGADLATGTAWNAYNAVTYYVDHERGRGESSAVESSLFGEGANLKTSALELALAYTEATRN